MKPDHAQLQRDLHDQLLISPEVIVSGARAGGVGGTGDAASGKWTLWFSLEAWRIGGSPCTLKPLVVHQYGLSQGEFDESTKTILGSGGFLKLRVRFISESQFGGPQAMLLEAIDFDLEDPEIANAVALLNEPKEHKDPILGIFHYDRAVDWYKGLIDWCNESIRLNLSMEQASTPEEVAGIAYDLCTDQPAWHARVLDCAVKNLLKTANDWWSEHNEGALSAEDFKSKITLESITVCPDGRFEFWFDDGDLFWGHSIAVRGSLAEGPTDASIEG